MHVRRKKSQCLDVIGHWIFSCIQYYKIMVFWNKTKKVFINRKTIGLVLCHVVKGAAGIISQVLMNMKIAVCPIMPKVWTIVEIFVKYSIVYQNMFKHGQG